MTSKQRAYLKSLAMKITPITTDWEIFGNTGIDIAVDEALEARELIKMHVLKNCFDDPKEIAQVIAERTRSEVVQVIGKKVVLYRESKDNKKIELPKPSKKA